MYKLSFEYNAICSLSIPIFTIFIRVDQLQIGRYKLPFRSWISWLKVYKIYPSSMKLAIFNLRTTVINSSLFRGCDVNLSYNGRSLHVFYFLPTIFPIRDSTGLHRVSEDARIAQGLLLQLEDCDRSLFS